MPSVAEFFMTLRRELSQDRTFSENRNVAMLVGATQIRAAVRGGTATIKEEK